MIGTFSDAALGNFENFTDRAHTNFVTVHIYLWANASIYGDDLPVHASIYGDGLPVLASIYGDDLPVHASIYGDGLPVLEGDGQ